MKLAVAICAVLVLSTTVAVAQKAPVLAPAPAPVPATAPSRQQQKSAQPAGPAGDAVFEDSTPRGPPRAPGADSPTRGVGGAAGSTQTGPPADQAPQAPIAAPEEPVCECPLPKDGGGYYGRGQQMVGSGCTCDNACEFVPTPSGGVKPSCATLCKCPHDIKVQTFTVRRGPVISSYPVGGGSSFLFGRRLLLSAAERGAGEGFSMFITY